METLDLNSILTKTNKQKYTKGTQENGIIPNIQRLKAI